MFEALLAWAADWFRRLIARAQRTAALADPVQDRLATLLAAQDEFLERVQRQASEQEARHALQIARLDAKHQQQMAELSRRVSAPPLRWGQPDGLLSFGTENAAQRASEPQPEEGELGEQGLAELAIHDSHDNMGADGGDNASPDESMTMAGTVTDHSTETALASTDVSPARPPGPGRAPARARARGSGQRRPKGEEHYRQNARYGKALQWYREGHLSAEDCLKAAGFERITASEKSHLRRLARQAKAADTTVAVASRKGSKAKKVSKKLPAPYRLTRNQVRCPLSC